MKFFLEIQICSFKKIHLQKSLSGNWWPFCLGLNVLKISHMVSEASYPLPMGREKAMMSFSWLFSRTFLVPILLCFSVMIFKSLYSVLNRNRAKILF